MPDAGLSRRRFLETLGAGAAALGAAGCLHARQEDGGMPQKPNVILIMTDDQGWGDIRSHGNAQIDTPVMDQLAADGARFERFFVSPVCAPTRASLLTGRYHLRTGVSGVTHGKEVMRAGEVTVATAFKPAGYATGCFGKWHNGEHYPHHPNGKGFDEFLGFCAGHWNNYFDTTLDHNGTPVRSRGFISDVFTDAAAAFIEKHKDRPLFVYLPYNAPHGPFQVSDKYFDKYKARGIGDRDAAIYGMVENVDDNIGRILKRLDDLHLADNTIVLFLTDNGPNGKRFNGLMRGTKGSIYEGGVRVPLFVRWPGRIKPGSVVREIAHHCDLFPTLVDLAGIPMPKTEPLDGMSLRPLLEGKTDGWPDRTIFTHKTRGGTVTPADGSLRSRRYRLVAGRRGYELYDMIADPAQKTNIAKARPEVLKTMRAEYERIFKDVTRKGFAPIPVPVGYAEADPVTIPAPLVAMKGSVKFKGRAGWANDWITGWTSTDDTLAWEIDVVRAGRYEPALLYACPAAEVGSRIRLEVGGQTVEAVLRKAHDPEPIPSPDRVPRGEVYEKVWASLVLPAVKLDKGRTRVTVRATTIPGKMVADLKAVRLRRLD